MNEAQIVIAARFLSLASADTVYCWLERHAAELNEQRTVPDALFAELYTRDEPLVKLAVARYCDDRHIIGTLYKAGDEVTRCAVLSNEVAWGSCAPSDVLDKSELRDLYHTGSSAELQALFGNAALRPYILQEVFEKSGPAKGLPEERWGNCVCYAAENPALAVMSGREHGVGTACAAAWSLLLSVPVTVWWAQVLRYVCRRVRFSIPLRKDETEVEFVRRALARWTPEGADTDQNADSSESDGGDSFRAACSDLRQAIATGVAKARLMETRAYRQYRQIPSKVDNPVLTLLQENADPAARIGYSDGVEQLTKAQDTPELRMQKRIIHLHTLLYVAIVFSAISAVGAVSAIWHSSTLFWGAIVILGSQAMLLRKLLREVRGDAWKLP